MKVRLFSDLHLECLDFTPPTAAADVVVLAGDVHTKARGVAWAARHFGDTPVLYVLGNHEYYGGQLVTSLTKLRQASAGTNVHVLDNDAVVLGGVRFLGTTLWTDYQLTGNQPLAEWDAVRTLQDFKYVRTPAYSRTKPVHFIAQHAIARRFLEQQLALPFDGPTVVVSHHGPTELSISPSRRDLPGHLSAAYASRLDALMGVPRFWLHGHTHDSLDYEMYDTRVVCNPRGYGSARTADAANPDINQAFDPCLLLEV